MKIGFLNPSMPLDADSVKKTIKKAENITNEKVTLASKVGEPLQLNIEGGRTAFEKLELRGWAIKKV